MDNYFKNKKRICCNDTGEICFGYKNYLKSQHWSLMRSRIIQSHPYCEICKSSEKPLQVHHLSYKRLGKEKNSDLTPLCDECHAAVHKMEKADVAKLFGLKVKEPKTTFKRKQNKPKANKTKPKQKRKICKGCVFYKRNDETKKYYCDRNKSRISGNTPACKHFTLGSR